MSKLLPPAIPRSPDDVMWEFVELMGCPDVFTAEKHRKMATIRGHICKSSPPGQMTLWEENADG